ncbi:tripartite tricarboxylate transporter TctB family protein [Paenisporosarcina sp.]|uniref:tripartite tricarboxylate transporter TctB family protein n=1 Tax=Paenisporosarcina sp. TaxID=1932001 RepID=UPI003C7571E1
MTLANRIISIILLVFSIFVWIGANEFPASNGQGLGPDFFPKVTAIILGVLATILFFKKEDTEESIFSFPRSAVPLFVSGLIALVLYVILIEFIGFTISTILLTFSWMWLMGIRKWITLIVASILISVGIAAVFEFLLFVPIPHGILY